jgi:hypothetical protein
VFNVHESATKRDTFAPVALSRENCKLSGGLQLDDIQY